MASNRIGRINEEIQRELASLLRTVKDPRVHGLVTITRVDTTPDLRYAKVYVSDHWTDVNPWGAVPDDDYIKIGELKGSSSHSMERPSRYFHEGTERQRLIVPRMYMQKVNALSIRVEGSGNAQFYLLEKEWRIK